MDETAGINLSYLSLPCFPSWHRPGLGDHVAVMYQNGIVDQVVRSTITEC